METFGAFDYGLSAKDEERARRIHEDSTIVDMIWWGPVGYRSFTESMNASLRADYEKDQDYDALLTRSRGLLGRLAAAGELPEYRSVWDASGVTAGHHQVSVGDPRQLLENVCYLDHLLGRLPWLHKALREEDFRRAKRNGEHALYLQCQPLPPISRDLSLIDLAFEAGLRTLQLTYNVQDAIGTGCTEKSAGGVSELGAKLIAKLNDLGIIVDTAHCNEQTVLDACELSERPVIASHTAAAGYYAHDRGISDQCAEAIAATGGLIGIATLPAFLGKGTPSVETMLDHIDHFTRTVGPQHLAIGTDWPLALPKWVLAIADELEPRNGFRDEHGIVSTQNLVGFDDYRDFPNITRGLVARGYRDEEVRGILGENFLRVFGSVCG